MKHLAVLDLETGGTNKKKNAIVEVALIAMDEIVTGKHRARS